MSRNARAALLAIAAIAMPLHAQTPAPQATTPQATFRGGTDLVMVDVSVLDGKRRPVKGLTAADFTILEDGQPREIQAFSEVTLPERVQARDTSWTREVPSDVTSNQSAQAEGRLVIIVLDRTIPLGEPSITARRIAAAAVNQLGPSDLAAVVSTNNGAVQNLTSDRARLMRAVNESDLASEISDEAKEIEADVFASTGRTWSTLNDGRCQCGLCVLDTIAHVADAVQGPSRRKKLMLFIGSDILLQHGGEAGNARNDVGCESRLRDSREAMFKAVDRANLTVHSIDPTGLENVTPVGRASSTLRAGPAISSAVPAGIAQNLQRHGNLEVLPDRTGGRAVANTNAPDLSMPEIFRESDSYYLLGFRPADRNANGKFHRITVTSTRKGVDVHARNGYTAPAPAAAPSKARGTVPEPMREALTGLLPATETSVDLNAAAFAVPGSRKSAIVLTVGVGGFATDASATAGAPRGGPLEIVATAFDTGGRPKGMACQSLELSWPASARPGAQRFDALSRLDLAPGEYEIRLAVSGAERTASVFSYVTIPAFNAAPLSLSNIVVGATPGTLTAPKDFVAQLLPIVPTTRREFTPSSRLTAFFRIYQGTARQDTLAPVQLRSTIVDAAGTVVAGETATLDAAQFAKDRTADHFISLPLATLAPGDYLLKVEASMGTRVAGRAMRFVVAE